MKTRERDKEVCWTLTEKPWSDAFVFFGGLDDGLWQGQRVADHGAIEAVLGHDGGPSPALFRLAPFGPPVLEPNLNGKKT